MKLIEEHCIGYFSNPLIKRNEDLEYTLGLFDNNIDHNINIFPRTTHLYKNNYEVLEPLLNEFKNNNSFLKTEILHQSSDLGLPYKLHSKHVSGYDLYYDGVLFRFSKRIIEGSYNLSNDLSQLKLPENFDLISSLQSVLIKVIPGLDDIFSSSQSFYAVDDNEWERFTDNPNHISQLKLRLIDNSIHTSTALIYYERGLPFNVYYGTSGTVLEMLSQDLFLKYEIESFLSYILNNHEQIEKLKDNIFLSYKNLFLPFYNLYRKLINWREIKKVYYSLIIKQRIYQKLKLFLKTLNSLCDKKLAFFNGPKQLFIENELMDKEVKIQHPRPHFIESELDKDRLEMKSSIRPIYFPLKRQIKLSIQNYEADYNKTILFARDIWTAYQTEFSAYAIWIALVALFISLILGLATLK